MWRTEWNLEADKAAERVGQKPEEAETDVALYYVANANRADGNGESDGDNESAGLLAVAGPSPMSPG